MKINYKKLEQNALIKGIVKVVLEQAAKNHSKTEIYLTFLTGPCSMSSRLKLAPKMSILLDTYYDLIVTDSDFSVTLAFGSESHRIIVPFSALIQFLDNANQYALEFDAEDIESSKDSTASSKVVKFNPNN